jgi:aminoglycoside phosphotransferase family enzyme/predicted kinase
MQIHPGLIDFLSTPKSYPERPASIVLHETHASLVFVGDTTVYKIKKPVDFGFLDFTTLEKRRFFCREEVRLNKRLAPGVYLGVVPVYGRAAEYSFRRQKGSAIVDYAVKMRRIPEERLLDYLIGQGRLLYGALGEVGAAIARFHANAPVHRDDPFGNVEVVRTNTNENFLQIASCRGITLDAAVYSLLASYTRDFITAHEPLFSARKRDGFVREGHGDLHSHHVCLLRPPIIVDCIEFNKRFRIGDVLEDMGFLLMDLEYHGRFDLSAAVSRAYFSLAPGAADPDLLRFYKVYRAVVRGKVEGFTADTATDEPGKQEAEQRARDYYLLARHYIEDHGSPFNPVVIMGISGSGKSAIAQDLLERAILLRSDRVRKELAGIPAGEHVYVDYGTGLYTEEMTTRVYQTMARRAVTAAKKGQRAVVDATFLTASQRLYFYDTCSREGLNPFFVYCFAEEKTLRDRINQRIADGNDLSDGHIAIMEKQLETIEEPAELPSYRVLRLDTGRDNPDTIQRALRQFLKPLASVRTRSW